MGSEINASQVSRELGDGGYLSLNRVLSGGTLPAQRFTVGIYHDSSSHQSWTESRVIGPKMRGFQSVQDGDGVLILFHGLADDEGDMLDGYTHVLHNLGYVVDREPDENRPGRDWLRVTKP